LISRDTTRIDKYSYRLERPTVKRKAMGTSICSRSIKFIMLIIIFLNNCQWNNGELRGRVSKKGSHTTGPRRALWNLWTIQRG
jgi:hypothetical protein